MTIVLNFVVVSKSNIDFLGSGLITDWEQQSGTLLASGDVRLIRVWDTHREMKLQVSVKIVPRDC